jgi:hypothetical protein
VSKEYNISSIKDFLSIPVESLDACLADFRAWVELARGGSELANDLNDFLGVPNATTFMLDSFIWIDDGISGISRVQLSDAAGDERARISFEDVAK